MYGITLRGWIILTDYDKRGTKMRLQRIYSSKLYLTSSRKDRIHAAIQDPINVELVQQLEDYLDDEAKAELKYAQNEIKMEKAADQAPISDDMGDTGSSSDSMPSHSGGSSFSPSSFSGSPIDDFGDDELADIDMPDDMGDSAPEPEPSTPEEPEPVESVTQEGKPITSSTAIIWTTMDDVVSDCDTIKGTLNTREDTNGVTRLEVKEHELWIYFNDDTNLNDKMVEVISVLNSTGYTYLKFNRLARSNNAMVFDVNLNVEPIKTVKEVEEEIK